MDRSSVTRPSPPSTRVLVADEGLCKQVAALLLCKAEPIRNAFIGEPVEDVLAMVRWALKHEDEEGFDAAKVLTDWARKRNRVYGERSRDERPGSSGVSRSRRTWTSMRQT